MIQLPILSLTIFLPLVGCLFIFMIKGKDQTSCENARSVALLTSIATFFMSLILWLEFDSSTSAFQFVEKQDWIPLFNIHYHVGIDGISLLFILLTTFLTPLVFIFDWNNQTPRLKEKLIFFLFLETLLIGVFSALDFILFYLFFEGVLIPMFFIIGIWGGERRIYAAFKFFLYTLLGSIFIIIGIIAIYFYTGSTDITEAIRYSFPYQTQLWLWLAFFASFAIKIPMWPVHTWLPDAHVEAPTAGSVFLAGILLKLGGYGFIRFSLPIVPDASQYFSTFMLVLSVIGVVYASLVALAQQDIKKLIAYSSIAHMGFVTLGTFTFSEVGLQGAIFQMISHGLISAALFWGVGTLYMRQKTREISNYGGVVHRMPLFAFLMMVFTIASVALPGTSGFVGELFVLLAAFQVKAWVAFTAGLGMILGACYMLRLYRRVFWGQLLNENLKNLKDVTPQEKFVFVSLLVFVILFGVYPKPVLSLSEAAVKNIVRIYKPVASKSISSLLSQPSFPLSGSSSSESSPSPSPTQEDSSRD